MNRLTAELFEKEEIARAHLVFWAESQVYGGIEAVCLVGVQEPERKRWIVL